MKMLLLILLIVLIVGVSLTVRCLNVARSYRRDMRNLVQSISAYGRRINPNFIIIPQNGHELLTKDGTKTGRLMISYLNAIDGIGRENLFYGYPEDDALSCQSKTDSMLPFMKIAEDNNLEVLVTDYCWTPSFVADSYARNEAYGFISFTPCSRGLYSIPTYPEFPHNVNNDDITSLAEARNFLFLLNLGKFDTKAEYLRALKKTNYDILIIDLFYDSWAEGKLTYDDVEALRVKANGGRRLVIAYLSIGEAEIFRFYWKDEWEDNPPDWLGEENPAWPGCFKVDFWDLEWQKIIFGEENSYLTKILAAGFDGVYLDLVDIFWYFEKR